MYVNADLYILNTEKQTWRKVISPGGPLPRTSHQTVVTRAYMYVFGGEFTSLNQKHFKHYNDLWRLRLDTWEWEQLPCRGGPSARSGHRMVLYKKRLLLFGGFYVRLICMDCVLSCRTQPGCISVIIVCVFYELLV